MPRTAAQKFNTFTAVELTPTTQYLKKVCSLPRIYHIAVTEVNSLMLIKVILIYCDDQTKPTHILDREQLLNVVIRVVSSTHYRPK